ncbi:MAG: hypothetical protein CMG66_03585 [Candidatus Marinimicrobia bacterium]|nr:hypothetical protein [Candidatus Neomarinimicrobiota bacterium]
MILIIIRLLFIVSLLTAANSHRCNLTEGLSKTRSYRPIQQYSFTQNGRFTVHYDLEGLHAIEDIDQDITGIPDYIEQVINAANTSYDFIVSLGYDDLYISDCDENILDTDNPLHCIHFGGDSSYDIYIKDLASTSNYVKYGENFLDNNFEGTSFIEIDNGFTEDAYHTNGEDAMKVTIAHEFFHAIQRSYRIDPADDVFFYEMSSVWMEDLIFPDVNDYINEVWTDELFDNPNVDITDYTTVKGYSLGLYAHYLSSVIDSDQDHSIILEMWQKFRSESSALTAINSVLESNYGLDFTRTFVDFCSLNFFNGYYSDEQNEFYYHADQVYAQPITIPVMTDFEPNVSIDKSFSGENLNVFGFDLDPNLIFDIGVSDNLLNSDIMGNIVLFSQSNLENQEVLSLGNFDEQYTNFESIYFILGSELPTDIAFNVFFCDEQAGGDVIQDCIINVLDYIKMVDFILQFETYNPLYDLNDDNECNVLDTIELVSQIMETP